MFLYSFADAQIEEGRRYMSQGTNNSISLEIPNADAKMTKKVWTKYLKDKTKGGKTKYTRKTDESFTDDAEYVPIGGANTLDIYAKFEDAGENCRATIWFDLGGAYLNSEMHGDKYNEGEKFLMRFAIAVAIEKTEEELAEEEKKQKNLEKDLDKLKKDKDGYHKDIEEAKQKIAEAEANIEQNIKDQASTETAIEIQDKVINKIKERLKSLKE